MAKNKSPRLYICLLVLFSLAFLASVGYLASWFSASRASADAYADLAQVVHSLQSTPTQAPETDSGGTAAEVFLPPAPPDTHDENGILLEYAPLLAENPHIAGWIRIEDTKINYPVMHAPDRKDHYLYRDFYGEHSDWGSIYAQEDCDLLTPSDNVILYGHNMKDGSMFAGLNDYASPAFWQDHRYIHFDTLTEHHIYEIFAVFTTTATQGSGFAYHDFVQARDAAEFDDFIRQCRSNALYDTGIIPVWGDKILCLSTCEYSRTNGRLVVAAVRIC